MHPSVQDTFIADLRTVQIAVQSGVVAGRAKAADSMWDRWLDFCADHAVDPWFAEGVDPIPYLQVFGARYRDGRIAPRGKPVRHRTVEDALRHVGQSYKSMGAKDIRLDPAGKIDFRIQRQLRSYKKEDPPPQRVKPIPIQVVRAVVNAAHNVQHADDGTRCIADMICLGFFFLLRPGEHTFTRDNTPFHLQDARVYIGNIRITNFRTATDAQFRAATSVSLTFTTQKNGVKGEVITHGRSGDPLTCPVRALVRRVRYLVGRDASPDTPLCTYYSHNNRMHRVTSANVTAALRAGIIIVGPDTLDIQPNEIDARSLRAGGATALLNAGIDHDTIQLLGRWHSDAMIRYLHLSAHPAVRSYASAMFAGGTFAFAPGTQVPVHP